MTKRIVRNARSVSQPVKIFDASKFVCSSNASNPVVFKPVSNFASDCQSVKPVRKLTNVNRKRPHERLADGKGSHQHDFTKPFSAVNSLIMSIYFCELVLLFFIFHQNFCNNNVDNFFKGYVRCNEFSSNEFLTSKFYVS